MSGTPFLELPGAVAADGADLGTVAHYGVFVAEQRPLAAGRAVVDQGHLGVLRLDGSDRLDWLDSLTSQRVRDLEPGRSAETLLLDVQGRVEHMIGVLDDGRSSWLIVERARLEPLRAWLERMRFLRDVRVEDASADYGVVATLGATPQTAALVEAAAPAGVPLLWRDPWPGIEPGGVGYWAGAAAEHPGREWRLELHLLERDALERLAGRVREGLVAASGQDALEALRVAAWRPRAARELDARTIPHELDLLRSSVHLDKGCYRGQETVAKVHNLGHPPRRLVRLDLDGSLAALPEPGAPLYPAGEPSPAGEGAGRMAGRITSVAQHHEDGPIALAIVKRGLDPEAVLACEVDGRALHCAQTAIVAPDAGRAAGLRRPPRLPRPGTAPDGR